MGKSSDASEWLLMVKTGKAESEQYRFPLCSPDNFATVLPKGFTCKDAELG
jgi:hypothetical protein